MNIKKIVAFSTITLTALSSITACSRPEQGNTEQTKTSAETSTSSSAAATRISLDDFDKLIQAGPVASSDAIEANTWASEIKQRGTFTYGGASTSPIFSLEDIKTGRNTGFDAGIAALLAHYILGDNIPVEDQITFQGVSTDTREPLLQNGSLDAVIATYSITAERLEKINYAGPYYSSGLTIMTSKENTDITSLEDLEGKNVAAQSNSTALPVLQDKVPSAQVTTFTDNTACLTAVRQGSVDAYVQDQAILLSALANDSNSGLKIVGDPFSDDLYGIGLSKDDSDAVEFVNQFLTDIEKDGTWKKLWDATVGPFLQQDAPQPPTIGDFGEAGALSASGAQSAAQGSSKDK